LPVFTIASMAQSDRMPPTWNGCSRACTTFSCGSTKFAAPGGCFCRERDKGGPSKPRP
jgi:hypothetical protein